MSANEETYTRDQVAARIRELAHSLDVLTDDDFALLAGVKLTTTDAWRRRGTGPSYVLLGTRYFYPRVAVAEFLTVKTRERSTTMRGSL